MPPAIGHDSSEPRWEQWPQWTNMPKRAPSNHVLWSMAPSLARREHRPAAALDRAWPNLKTPSGVPGRSRGDGERAWAKPVALVTAAMLLVVGAAVAWQALRRPVGGLGAVRRMVTSNGRFDTGSSGAATFARIGNELLADAKRCQGRHAGPSRPDRRADGDVRCIARFQAWVQASVAKYNQIVKNRSWWKKAALRTR